jgi:peptidoglycan/xylan/chitin deacetylase (PgdA/CDA1 family)
MILIVSGFGPVRGFRLQPDQPIKEVAVTFDDLPLNGPDMGVEQLKNMTAQLVAVIRRNQIPVVAFVNESKLERPGEVEQRTAVLRMWLDAGAELGNHTYSHPSLQRTDLAAYEQNVIQGEATISRLMKERHQGVRYFRYPFLQTGPDVATKKAFESFLKERGYTNAPVTIDNSDWAFNTVYVNALKHGDGGLARRVEDAYLQYIPQTVDFFEGMSGDVLGRQVKHILLLHANPLNAGHLEEVVAILRQRGYRFITLARALEDQAYSLPDNYAGPMGVSWLERWAFTKGMKMRVNEEPDPPDFVNKLYKEYTRPAPSGG